MKITTTEQIRTILWFKDIAVYHPNISRRFIAKFVGCHKEIVNKIFAKGSNPFLIASVALVFFFSL